MICLCLPFKYWYTGLAKGPGARVRGRYAHIPEHHWSMKTNAIPGLLPPPELREAVGGVCTPLNAQEWEAVQRNHPDKEHMSYLLQGILHGLGNEPEMADMDCSTSGAVHCPARANESPYLTLLCQVFLHHSWFLGHISVLSATLPRLKPILKPPPTRKVEAHCRPIVCSGEKCERQASVFPRIRLHVRGSINYTEAGEVCQTSETGYCVLAGAYRARECVIRAS